MTVSLKRKVLEDLKPSQRIRRPLVVGQNTALQSTF